MPTYDETTLRSAAQSLATRAMLSRKVWEALIARRKRLKRPK